MALNYTLDLRLSEKEFVYRTGVTFRGLTISQTQTGWNVVIRGFDRERTPVYSILQHTDAPAALEMLVRALGGKSGPQMWHKDKYYSARKKS